MWKSKAQPIAITSFILTALLLSGCFRIEPTYTKEKVAESITSLCRKEYNITPQVWLVGETVWIYLPLPRLVTKEIKLDNEMAKKINKVIVASSRVVLSMKPRPQFIAMVASDIQEYGIDYYIISWIPDIVKFHLQFISWDEFSRRMVIRTEQNLLALADRRGTHIAKREIKMNLFLAEQIAQRVHLKFAFDQNLKDYFEVKQVDAGYKDETFKIDAKIKQIKNLPAGLGSVDTQKEIAKIVAYVVREYGLKDFRWLEVKNSVTGEETLFSGFDLKKLLR